MEKRGLGRGLSALMADIDPGTARIGPVGLSRPESLPVEALTPNPNQPRTDFPQAALETLAASIRQKGIIQPLVVRPTKVVGVYEIVAGERRWRAAQLAGLHVVPVVVREFSDAEVIEVAIIENIQRADLNAIEEALAYRQLIERFGHTQEKLAEALSRSRSHVANLLRLLNLPDDVQAMIRSGDLTAGHARALVTLPNASDLAQRIVKSGLSVRETERLAKVSLPPRATRQRRERQEKDADTRALETDLSANLHMLVRIEHNGFDDGGTLSVRYRTLDDLDILCDVLSKIPRDYLPSRKFP